MTIIASSHLGGIFSPCGRRRGSAIEMGPKTHRRHGPNNKHIKSITRPGWCVTWIAGYIGEELQKLEELEELQELEELEELELCAAVARLLCPTVWLHICSSALPIFSFLFSIFLFSYSPAQNLRLMTSRADKKSPKKKEGEGQPDTRKRVTPPSSVLTFTALIKCAAPRPSLYLLQLKKLLKLVV